MSAVVPVPQLDTRTYQDLVDEAIARIPVHNPEWTNFNRSDPGITLLELFAFLTESLLYRANQIPERNRLAFLSLLGVPLQPASSARGIVTLSNDNGRQQMITLHEDVEVRAGAVPFRTELELDVLPVEARAYCKVPTVASQQLQEYYATLYASYTGGPKPDATTLQLYATTPLPATGIDLATTSDRSLWIALLLRKADGKGDDALATARGVLEGATLNLGIVPILDDPEAQLSPLGRSVSDTQGRLVYQLPAVPADTLSLGPANDRTPKYNSLDPQVTVNVLDEPGIVQLTLPDKQRLVLWEDIDPLEAGVGEFPPALEDTTVAPRVITWLRIKRRERHGEAPLGRHQRRHCDAAGAGRRRGAAERDRRARPGGAPIARADPPRLGEPHRRRDGVDARRRPLLRRAGGAGARPAALARRAAAAAGGDDDVRARRCDRHHHVRRRAARRTAAGRLADARRLRVRERWRGQRRRRRDHRQSCAARRRQGDESRAHVGRRRGGDDRRRREADHAVPPAPRPARHRRRLRHDRPAHARDRDRAHRRDPRLQPRARAERAGRRGGRRDADGGPEVRPGASCRHRSPTSRSSTRSATTSIRGGS